MKSTLAWAIDLRFDGEPGHYCGIYNFTHDIKPYQDGMRTVLFRTREEARKNLKRLKGEESNYWQSYWTPARVVKVKVTIEESK